MSESGAENGTDRGYGRKTAERLWRERIGFQIAFYEKLKAQLENSGAVHE